MLSLTRRGSEASCSELVTLEVDEACDTRFRDVLLSKSTTVVAVLLQVLTRPWLQVAQMLEHCVLPPLLDTGVIRKGEIIVNS